MPDYMDQSPDHMLNHPWEPPEGMAPYPGHPHPAPLNDDQIPIFSKVGRGIAGDAYKVKIKHGEGCTSPDCENCEDCDHKNECTCTEFYLEGYNVDGSNGQETLEWTSGNLSGGHLLYPGYNIVSRPWNDPPTFNMSWTYLRPPCCSWSWTSPNIPYCWDESDEHTGTGDDFVGSGLGSLFIRTDKEEHSDDVFSLLDEAEKKKYSTWTYQQSLDNNPNDALWIERLRYPDGTNRDYFNAPSARPFFSPAQDTYKDTDPWTSTISFGFHGDVMVPNIYDMAKLLGWKPNEIPPLIEDKPDAPKKPVQDQVDDLQEQHNQHVENFNTYKDLNQNVGYVQFPIYNWDDYFNYVDLQPDGSAGLKYEVSGGLHGPAIQHDENFPQAYAQRILFTFKPSIKIMNPRISVYAYVDKPITFEKERVYWFNGMDGDTDNYGDAHAIGFGPGWFAPKTTKYYPNSILIMYWEQDKWNEVNLTRYATLVIAPTADKKYCKCGIQVNTSFQLPCPGNFTLKATQAPIFYQDWGITEVDTHGDPLCNVNASGTEDRYDTNGSGVPGE